MDSMEEEILIVFGQLFEDEGRVFEKQLKGTRHSGALIYMKMDGL